MTTCGRRTAGWGASRYSVFVLFEGEDGIRDGRVTGVQTCALPILLLESWAYGRSDRARHPLRKPNFREARGGASLAPNPNSTLWGEAKGFPRLRRGPLPGRRSNATAIRSSARFRPASPHDGGRRA